MPGRHGGSSYRYSFNGKEKDDEIKGNGNHLDFGARAYDSRLGRFMSLDAHTSSYPFLSPYVFVANKPITHIDPDGNDIIDFLLLLNTKFATAIKLTNGSEVFSQYLKMFASTTGGDDIGQIEDGIYSDIDIVFNTNNLDINDDESGLSEIEIFNHSTGRWDQLSAYDGDFRKFNPQRDIRIVISLNLGGMQNSKISERILLILHEFAVHSLKSAEMIYAMQTTNYTVQNLQQDYLRRLQNDEDHYQIGENDYKFLNHNELYDAMVKDVGVSISENKSYQYKTESTSSLGGEYVREFLYDNKMRVFGKNNQNLFFINQMLLYNRFLEKTMDYKRGANLSKIPKNDQSECNPDCKTTEKTKL